MVVELEKKCHQNIEKGETSFGRVCGSYQEHKFLSSTENHKQGCENVKNELLSHFTRH